MKIDWNLDLKYQNMSDGWKMDPIVFMNLEYMVASV